MIMLNNKEIVTDTKPETSVKDAWVDMFHKEIDAYCTYKQWKEDSEDLMLDIALEEIMEDEYLHARFLRNYLMNNDMYTPDSNDPYEKKFWKIHKRLFRD